jgi:flagellar basal-body rod protein FlgF
MDRLIYVAMSGAKHTLEQQAVVANNLANVSTTGFKAMLTAFRAAPVIGPGSPTRAFVADSTIGSDFAPGSVMVTNRPLDIALKGAGWIAVRGPDGKESYTRDGGLQINANGLLQTRTGLNVLSEGGNISIPPNNRPAIGEDGTVSIIPTDTIPNAVTIVGRIKLVNPPTATLERTGNGLFKTTNGRPAPADPNVQVTSGALEGGNVSASEMLVQMISQARQFETQIKLLTTADTDAQRWSQVMNLSA